MTRFMRELMAERINYGGICATRAQVYADALKATSSEKAAEMFAFGPNARMLSDEEAERLIPFSVWEAAMLRASSCQAASRGQLRAMIDALRDRITELESLVRGYQAAAGKAEGALRAALEYAGNSEFIGAREVAAKCMDALSEIKSRK